MNQSKKITDGALLTAVYIVLLLMVMFIPFVILIGIFLLPVPFIMYAARHDWKPTLLMFMAAIFMSFIIATAVSLPLTVLAGIGGTMIGSAIKRDLNAYETWARGAIGFIIGLLFIVMFVQVILDVNLTQEIDEMIKESLQITKMFMEQAGVLNDRSAELQLIEEQMGMFVDLLPSSIAIMGIIIAFLSQWIGYRVISRIENRSLSFPPFRKLNLPVAVVWIYFIVLMISFFDLNKDDSLYIVIINAITLLVALLIIQGFSFVFFYADLKKMSKAIPIIIVISSLILP